MTCKTILGVALFGLVSIAGQRSAYAQWQWVNPLPNGNFTESLIWDGAQFLGVDDAGQVNTSPDGLTWSSRPSGSIDLHALAFNGSVYVAVGFFGDIRTSTDGITWTGRSSGTQETMYGVTWGDGQFVAVGGTWDDPSTGDALVLTSPDGVEWTAQATPASVTTALDSIAWNGSQFVATGYFGLIMTSPDAATWTVQDSAYDLRLSAVIWNGDMFTTVGDDGTILTSVDGAAWDIARAADGQGLDRIIWTGRPVHRVGRRRRHSHFARRRRLDAAIVRNIRRALRDRGRRHRNRRPGRHGHGSHLGRRHRMDELTSSSLTEETLNTVAWNGSEFIALGDGGSVLTSADGVRLGRPAVRTAVRFDGDRVGQRAFRRHRVRWRDCHLRRTDSPGQQQTSGTSADLFGVTWGDSQFVAVGATPGSLGSPGIGVILTSADGADWTLEDSQSVAGDRIASVVWGGDKFVAVGAGPTPIFTSTDGHVWTRQQLAPGAGPALLSVTWNGSLFVAAGNSANLPIDPRVIATSPDAVQWTFQALPIDVDFATGLTGVVWSGDRFIAVGGFGIELHSADGVTWVPGYTGSVAQFSAIATTGTRCVAVGAEGAIMTNPTCSTNAILDPIFASGFDVR